RVMGVLHLENVPDKLMKYLESIAAANQVGVSEAAVRLLEQGMATDQAAQPPRNHMREPPWVGGRLLDLDEGGKEKPRTEVLEILDRMWRNSIVPKPGTPDSLELLREDRER